MSNKKIQLIQDFLSEIDRAFSKITFDPIPHKYEYEGNTGISVTKLVHHYVPEFDLEKMSELTAKKKGVSQKEIKDLWEKNLIASGEKGTITHKYLENSILGISKESEEQFLFDAYPNTLIQVKNFIEDIKESEYVFVATEQRVVDKTVWLFGSLDLIVFNTKTNLFEIFDFKTSKKIEHSKYGNLLFPVNYLDQGEINTYSIQLDLYKKMLKKEVTFEFGPNKIIHFNDRKNENYSIIELKDQSKAVDLIYKDYYHIL
jgi:hypothetical protein